MFPTSGVSHSSETFVIVKSVHYSQYVDMFVSFRHLWLEVGTQHPNQVRDFVSKKCRNIEYMSTYKDFSGKYVISVNLCYALLHFLRSGNVM